MDNDLISRSTLLTELRSKSMLSAFPQYRTWTEMPSLERNAVCTYANKVKGIISEAPSVDAEPVRHGRYDAGGDCTVCGYPMPTDDRCDAIFPDEIKYCYNCGAKMDAEVEG